MTQNTRQVSLTDDQFASNLSPMHKRKRAREALDPDEILESHTVMGDHEIELTGMAFYAPDRVEIDDDGNVTSVEGGSAFPAPENITKLVENERISTGSTPAEVEDADPWNGVFLAMDAVEVYEFLEKMQKKTDWWLKNKEKDLVRHGLCGRKEYAHVDKQQIVSWEKRRRIAEQGEWNPLPESNGWQSLPNASE